MVTANSSRSREYGRGDRGGEKKAGDEVAWNSHATLFQFIYSPQLVSVEGFFPWD
jgi:hypothetical protein